VPEPDSSLPILRTKLRPPRVTSKVIQRGRLNRMLEENLELPVTLVSAPAGCGKSTLVAEWLSARGVRAAWLSLDREDSELPVFLRYLLPSPGVCEPR
jgi:LuxR family maltose regulon positive regulatory protein